MGMMMGMIIYNIRNWERIKACRQVSWTVLSQKAAISGGMSPMLPKLSPVYRMMSGMAVKSSGMRATVKSTKRFLKTSAHSLRMMTYILFMGLPRGESGYISRRR